MANFMLPGALLAAAAAILLIFVSVSSPTWNNIFFLQAVSGSDVIHFGCFGFTGTGTSFGYFFPSNLAPESGLVHSSGITPSSTTLSNSTSSLNTDVVHNLTKTLFLHPLAAGFAGFAAIAGFAIHRVAAIFFTTLAFLTTLVAWVLSMVLFGIVRHRIRDAEGTDSASQYGNAEWLTLGALVALLLAWWLVLFGAFCSHRHRHRY